MVNVQENEPNFDLYSYFVLAIILLSRTTNQWQRKSLDYAFGYKGSADQLKNPLYEISTSYPEMAENYGLLTGLS